jgi:hypothetical protein
MDTREVPRIGNRSNALELLAQLIDAIYGDEKAGEFIRQPLEAIRDAAERGVKSGIMVRDRAMVFGLAPSRYLLRWQGRVQEG